MNSNRVKRSSCTAALTNGEVKEYKGPAELVFIHVNSEMINYWILSL